MMIGVAGCDTEDALVIPDEKVDENTTPGDESGVEKKIPERSLLLMKVKRMTAVIILTARLCLR